MVATSALVLSPGLVVATSGLVVVVGSVEETSLTRGTEVVGLLSVVVRVVAARVFGTDEVEVVVGDEDTVDEISVAGSGSVARIVDVCVVVEG